MHKFVRQLMTEWRRLGLPVANAAVVVGVSGGADSTALLAAVADLKKRKKLDIEVIAVHFNHKLRGGESDADESFVGELADRMGVIFVAGQGKMAGTSNLEQRAREARYAFLGRVAEKKKATHVLTAHTVSDQAETFLINLIRGSGPDGLAAMPPTRPLLASAAAKSEIRNPKSEITLARPLLRWALRADTEGFCNENGIKYRRDAMNDDPRFARVRVRKEILPKMAELNPKIVEALARTASLLSGPEASATGFRDGPERARKPASRIVTGSGPSPPTGGRLPVKIIKDLPKTELYHVLRTWLRRERGDLRGISLKHLEAVERLVRSQKSGRVVELPRAGRVIKSGGSLRFE